MDADSIQDLFQEIGPVRVRSMFGGKGLYVGDQMFGLEAAGEIYLKTDATNRPAFEAAGSRPFTYRKDGGTPVATSYWLLPSAAADDPSEAARWARLALEAARRAVTSKRPKKNKR